MNQKKTRPEASDSEVEGSDLKSKSKPLKVPYSHIRSALESVGRVMSSFTIAQAIDKLTAALLTHTYASNCAHWYQCEIWEIYQSYMKGLQAKPEEDESD